MSIVLPIVFFAVALGLSVRRIAPLHWGVMTVWIALVIAYNYAKH